MTTSASSMTSPHMTKKERDTMNAKFGSLLRENKQVSTVQLRQQHEAAEAAAAAEAEAEKLELSELTESARLDVVAQQKASAAAEAELRAAQVGT